MSFFKPLGAIIQHGARHINLVLLYLSVTNGCRDIHWHATEPRLIRSMIFQSHATQGPRDKGNSDKLASFIGGASTLFTVGHIAGGLYLCARPRQALAQAVDGTGFGHDEVVF